MSFLIACFCTLAKALNPKEECLRYQLRLMHKKNLPLKEIEWATG